jgi:general secretion pathway protein B
MSLILEALRRSEAERRRGAPPTLLGGEFPRPRARSPWPLALGGLALGLLLASAIAWWFAHGHRPGAPDEAGTDASIARVVAEPAAPPEPAAEPIPAAAYAPTSVAPNRDARADRASASSPSSPSTPAPALRVPPAVTPPVLTPPSITDASTETGRGPRDGDLRWADVRGAAGESLPPLRVSMHVYADDPARRFAIVDGQRRREGEPLQPSMTLLEIRRDGLRIGWQDRVLWVPR